MRYWGLLIGKLAAWGAISYGLLLAIDSFWPSPLWLYNVRASSRFGFDLAYTSAIGLWFLISAGLLYLCIWDQRYRCRVCLRRLRMPIATGSWSAMLLLGRFFIKPKRCAHIKSGLCYYLHVLIGIGQRMGCRILLITRLTVNIV